MRKPKREKEYVFVRTREGETETALFTRHEDGSGSFVLQGQVYGFDCSPHAWEIALAELGRLGFQPAEL